MINLNCAGCNKTINVIEDSKIELEDGKTTVYCSDECKKAPSFIRKNGTKGVCVKCSSEFDVKSPWQKFCSNNCRIKDHRYKTDYKSRINGIVHGFHNITASFEIPLEEIEVTQTSNIEMVDGIVKMDVSLRQGEYIYNRLKDATFIFKLVHEYLGDLSPLVEQSFSCSGMKRNFKFSRGLVSMVTLVFRCNKE